MNMCELEEENRDVEFKNRNLKNELQKHLLSLKYNEDKNQKKILFLKLVVVNLKLRNYNAALLYSKCGLEIINDNEETNKKLEYFQNKCLTELKILKNSKIQLTEQKSSIIELDILQLFKKSGYIHVPVNCFSIIDNNKPRFIGVMGVLTCISIFLISKNKTFVCHLPFSSLNCIESNKKLLKKYLKNEKWSKVIFVGGHKESDFVFKCLFFSKEIISLIQSILPNIEIDISKLNIFNGKNIKNIEDEKNLRKKNTRFVICVYDCYNKVILTHTDYLTENVVLNYLHKIYQFEKNYYSKINIINGETIKKKSLYL